MVVHRNNLVSLVAPCWRGSGQKGVEVKRPLVSFVAAVVSVVMLGASACSGSGKSAANGTIGAATSATPQQGGVITIGEFSAPPGLDPAKLAGGTASVGGMEFAAIYDTLMRLDPATGKYEPADSEVADGQ